MFVECFLGVCIVQFSSASANGGCAPLEPDFLNDYCCGPLVVLTNLCVQLSDGDQLESKFRQMEGGDVDEELNKMKRGLPAASSSSSSNSSSSNSNAGRPVR